VKETIRLVNPAWVVATECTMGLRRLTLAVVDQEMSHSFRETLRGHQHATSACAASS
jgi:hypothetical protein